MHLAFKDARLEADFRRLLFQQHRTLEMIGALEPLLYGMLAAAAIQEDAGAWRLAAALLLLMLGLALKCWLSLDWRGPSLPGRDLLVCLLHPCQLLRWASARGVGRARFVCAVRSCAAQRTVNSDAKARVAGPALCWAAASRRGADVLPLRPPCLLHSPGSCSLFIRHAPGVYRLACRSGLAFWPAQLVGSTTPW